MSRYEESLLLIDAAESIWNGSNAKLNITMGVGPKLMERMRHHFPDGLASVFITGSDIRHIKRKHGNNEEQRGQSTIIPRDLGCIPTVLHEFDSCTFTDTDKLGNKKFLLRKNISTNVYLATIQRGKHKLEIKTMWKEHRSGASC